MIRIDTTNILFICGGAFDGLVPIIENRIGRKYLGSARRCRASGILHGRTH